MTKTETRAETRKRAEHIRDHTAADAPAPRMLVGVHEVLAMLDADAALARVAALQQRVEPSCQCGEQHGPVCSVCVLLDDEWPCATVRVITDRAHAAPLRRIEQETFSERMERKTAEAARIAVGGYPDVEPGELEAIEDEDRSREDDFLDHTDRMDLAIQNGDDR